MASRPVSNDTEVTSAASGGTAAPCALGRWRWDADGAMVGVAWPADVVLPGSVHPCASTISIISSCSVMLECFPWWTSANGRQVGPTSRGSGRPEEILYSFPVLCLEMKQSILWGVQTCHDLIEGKCYDPKKK